MEFVNAIGKIVHTETHLHAGSANKNIGDAFLLVWKFPANVRLSDVENPAGAKADATLAMQTVAVRTYVALCPWCEPNHIPSR